jgi:hypothetical protein
MQFTLPSPIGINSKDKQPPLQLFYDYLSHFKTMVNCVNDFNYINHFLFVALNNYTKYGHGNFNWTEALYYCSICLSLNMRKVGMGNSLISQIENIMETLQMKMRVSVLGQDDSTELVRNCNSNMNDIINVNDYKPKKQLEMENFKEKIIPKFILKKVDAFENYPLIEFKMLPERKIGTIFF